ncbi:uncharacterized protein AB9W97_003260 isoform 1-T4 [Spinachia spinachia]
MPTTARPVAVLGEGGSKGQRSNPHRPHNRSGHQHPSRPTGRVLIASEEVLEVWAARTPLERLPADGCGAGDSGFRRSITSPGLGATYCILLVRCLGDFSAVDEHGDGVAEAGWAHQQPGGVCSWTEGGAVFGLPRGEWARASPALQTVPAP